MSFKQGFTWGVASASYQIEGAPFEDGKGASVWDMFTRKPGAIWRGQNGDVACDHYHRAADDAKLMGDLGLRAYRFSLSWPRILPEGRGRVNEPGLAFYDRLVDHLLAAGVTPWVTLFHWDYPLALYHRGGWLNPDSPDWFAEYAGVVVDRLSDRVRHWMTLNEPQCFVLLGHQNGYHAPGDKLRLDEVLRIAHNVLLAHGKAVQTIRSRTKQAAQIGFAPVGCTMMPMTNDREDVEAARQSMFSVPTRDATGCGNLFCNSWWMDPVFLGRYPGDGLAQFGSAMPTLQDGDLRTIAQPLDFFGANIYHGTRLRATADGRAENVPLPPGYPKTTQDFWPVTPECLYWGPKFFHERYGLPIVITENGHQNADVISLDGQVHDPQRIDYLHRHLRELRRAARDGVPVDGYFQWCFTDNFEWAMGDAIRVGLVYTDYATQRRIPKDAAFWYRRVIETNGAEL